MNKTVLGVLAVLIVLGGALFLFKGKTQAPTQTEITENKDSAMQETSENVDKEAPKAGTVEIKDFAFSPQTITIKSGESVTWVNKDLPKHTATSDEGSAFVFDTELLATGESGSVKFDKPGTYTYHCTPHPNVKGTVVVE